MRIGFDARPLLGQRTGVGVWLGGLLEALAASTDWSFVGFLPRRAQFGVEGVPPERLAGVWSPVPLPGTLWLHTVAAAQVKQKVDLFVGTLAILPRRLEVPSVAMVHDLTPRTHPHRHTLANRFCFNAYLESSLGQASVVVCPSQATRARLAQLFPKTAQGAVVIGPGVDAPFFLCPPFSADETRRRFAGGKRFLVQLGTLEPRKGVDTLLHAHAQLCQRLPQAPALVLAGGRGWGGQWLERALADHPVPSLVHRPGYVSREEARSLLAHAEAVVLASEEEGFGLPLAEAMACGAACVASDAPALVEVAGGAARHFPRRDVQALAGALEEVLVQPARQAELREQARGRAHHWRWELVVPHWRSLLTTAAAGAGEGVDSPCQPGGQRETASPRQGSAPPG